jgi:GGDEF domain-containing protein
VRLFNTIKEQLRTVDMVMADRENGRFVILCPEIDAQGANMLTDRIGKALSSQLGINISHGVASFPEEALTFEALLTEADGHLKQVDSHAGETDVPPLRQDRLQAVS